MKTLLNTLVIFLGTVVVFSLKAEENPLPFWVNFKYWKARKPIDSSTKAKLEEGVRSWTVNIGDSELPRYGFYETNFDRHTYRVAVIFDPEIDPILHEWLEKAKTVIHPDETGSNLILVNRIIKYIEDTLPGAGYKFNADTEYHPLFLGDMIAQKAAHPVGREAAFRILLAQFHIPHITFRNNTELILDGMPMEISVPHFYRSIFSYDRRPEIALRKEDKAQESDHMKRSTEALVQDIARFRREGIPGRGYQGFHFLDENNFSKLFRTSNPLFVPFSCVSHLVGLAMFERPVRKRAD